jgi:hypothetical protein
MPYREVQVEVVVGERDPDEEDQRNKVGRDVSGRGAHHAPPSRPNRQSSQ